MKLTLRVVRECQDYTIGEVAEHCGVTAEEMEGYEKGIKDTPLSIGVRLSRLYGIPMDYIDWEAEQAV